MDAGYFVMVAGAVLVGGWCCFVQGVKAGRVEGASDALSDLRASGCGCPGVVTGRTVA